METSVQLWQVVEDECIFSPAKKAHQGFSNGNFMLFNVYEDGEDGTFPRVSDYTRLINRMDKYGVTEYLNWSLRRKRKADFGYCTVTREAKYSNEAVLDFKEPIKVEFGKINGEPIIREVNQIKGNFDFDWFWVKNGRQNKVANGFEVWFDCKEFFNTTLKQTA